MTTDEGRAYGWDEDPIEEPVENSGFVLLPIGIYPFVVTKFERARHEKDPNSKKANPLPSCNKAIVTVTVDGGEHGTTEIKSNIFLHSRCEGIICSFFTSLGHREHGQPLKMDWGRVVGGTGICKITQKPGFKDPSKTFNEISAWLEPTSGTTAPPAAETEEIPF